MASYSQDINTRVTTLTPNPEVTIWYCRIPDIIGSIFTKNMDLNSRPPLNKIFKKEEFLHPLFNDEEIHTLNHFKALKKQIEWISGRYLIKHMVQHFFLEGCSLDQITLSYLEQGAPFLTRHPGIPISLSHSNDYTTAACSKSKEQTIGIDIEKITEKPDIYFMKTAFTQNEINHLKQNADPGPDPVFKNWTIKEAYLKYIQKGFNESLHRVEVIGNKIRHNQKTINVDVYSTFIDKKYVLSLVSD